MNVNCFIAKSKVLIIGQQYVTARMLSEADAIEKNGIRLVISIAVSKLSCGSMFHLLKR